MIVKLTLADAIAVVKEMRDDDHRAVKALLGNVGDEVVAVNRWQTPGPAWSLFQDNEPVAIFGISMPQEWTGTAWLMMKPNLSGQSKRKLVRHCRTVAANLKESSLHRVEALVMEDWPEAIKFVRRLGFRYEGTKLAAGSRGENFQIWAYGDI